MPCSDSVAQKISQNVGEGHDPPGRTQKHFALRFGEFGPNSLRICPSFFENPVPAAGRVMTLPYGKC